MSSPKCLLPIVILMCVACGSSKTQTVSNNNNNNNNNGDSNQQIDTGPIIIGITIPESGGSASRGTDESSGYSAAVAWINSLGGLLGREVQLQVADMASSPDGGVTETNALVDTYHPAAVMGYLLSSDIGPPMEQRKTPYVTFFWSGPLNGPRNYIFRPLAASGAAIKVEALDITKRGYKTIAYASNGQFSQPPFWDDLHKLNPTVTWFPVTYPQPHDASSFDATSYIQTALAHNPPPDAFYIYSSDEPTAVQVLVALNNNSFPNADIYLNETMANIPFEYDSATNVTSVRIAQVDASIPVTSGVQDSCFNKYTEFSGGATADADSGFAFDTSMWLFLAIAKAGTTSGPAIQQGLIDVVSDTSATKIDGGTLDKGLDLISQGKNVWYVSAGVPPFTLSAPGQDPALPYCVFAGESATPADGDSYTPEQYNLPEFD